jgi:hypothetical protein
MFGAGTLTMFGAGTLAALGAGMLTRAAMISRRQLAFYDKPVALADFYVFCVLVERPCRVE